MRRSRKDCQQVLNVIRTHTGLNFELHWESKGAKLVLPHGPGWKEISERMPPTAMYSWLEAMEIGLGYGATNLSFKHILDRERADRERAARERAARERVVRERR